MPILILVPMVVHDAGRPAPAPNWAHRERPVGNNGAMALNVNRWLNYAKARIDAAVGSGHESLDRLEAKQEADRADKPWLASDSTAPTFDEARARIAWEADQQAKKAARHQAAEGADGTAPAAAPDDETEPDGTGSPTDRAAGADATATGTKPKPGGTGAKGPGATGAEAKTGGTGAKSPGTKGAKAKTKGTTEGPGVSDRETSDGPGDLHGTETDRASAATGQPAGQGPKGSSSTGSDPAPSGDAEIDSVPPPRSPQQIALDAERETARLELEDRQQKSAERLAEIRRELGIDDPPTS